MQEDFDYKKAYNQLAGLVSEMRKAQKSFTRTKDRAYLKKVFAIGDQIDNFLTPKQTEQQKLFEYLAR